MKRHILLISALYFSAWIMGGVRVSIEEAQRVATEYYQLVAKDTKGECRAGTPETCSLLGIADMYLVPVNDSWILVSSDKRTETVLARFTTRERPNFNNYPPAAQYLISCYEHDIAYVRDSCTNCPFVEYWKEETQRKNTQNGGSRSNPSSVEPLLGYYQAWGQMGPTSQPCEYAYNKFCPSIITNNLDLCDHAVVGCIAVAMAQIMWYWHWPYIATVPTTIGGSTNEFRFYNWDMMPEAITGSSSIANVNEIATLLKDCGYSVNMDYGEESLARDEDVIGAMTAAFGYDATSMDLHYKWNTSSWNDYLHNEIASGRPVYYSGRTAVVGGEGHVFVLDGYDAGGLYHANLGWGGGDFSYEHNNNYFFIDTITAYNIQGGPKKYSYNQAAIWGIQPDSVSFCPAITILPIYSAFSTFGIARAGAITLDGVVLSSNANWKIYSSTSITLSAGTEIPLGAEAEFAIKDVPCSSAQNTRSCAPKKEKIKMLSPQEATNSSNLLSIYPNPAVNGIQIKSEMPLENIFIYNLRGSVVLHSTQNQIDVSPLSKGLYLIRAITTDGQILQTKFIHE